LRPEDQNGAELSPVGGSASSSPDAADWAMLSVSLRRFGLALTSRSHEAEDLVQQALAKVMAEAPAYAAHAGYLRTTMTRLWLDKKRSTRRELARLARVASARVGVSGGRAGRGYLHADDQEQLARVRAAMDLLPPRQHAALALRLIEELDYPAIAEALGIAVSAARASVHLARERVRKALEVRP
jgi:RNA polymerase sigma-70 factor (ECF subfamily)